uniref:Uncharacterized protein n=1 Tax=Megaselia scalaris TaxID=36166 RepID=T1GKA1_MEGSC
MGSIGNSQASHSMSVSPFCEMSLERFWPFIARSSSVPPHFTPKAIRADFKRSKPSKTNSSHEEKADKSK